MNLRRKIGLTISLAGFAITINTFPALVTWFSDKLSIPSSNFGIVFLAQYIAFTFFSIATGKLHARYKLPLQAILITALLLASTGVFFIGFYNSFFSLMVLLIIIGGCGGLVEAIGTALLAEGSQNGNMIYTSQFFYAIGAFSAPLLIGITINAGIAVPVIGRAVGAFAFGIGLLVWFLVFSKKETELTPLKIDTPDGKEPITKIVRTDHRGFAWLFTAMVSYVVFESVMQNWLPTFLQEARGKTAGDASLILTVFWVGLGITRLSYAFFKKKSTKVPLLIQALILLVSAVALAMTSATTSPILIIIIIGFIGIGAGPIWPLIVEHCSDTYQNESLVMYLVAAGSIGGIVGPSLSSLVFSYAHISYMSILLVGYHLICVFTIIIATKERKHV